MKAMTTKEFVRLARRVHGTKYSYADTNYKSLRNLVTITCRVHGKFKRIAGTHVYNGYGCRKCGKESYTRTRSRSTEDFVREAIDIHGHRYSYKKSKYVSRKSKVIITCSVHGDFKQSPATHLRGCGCSKCSRFSDASAFIQKANSIHGDRFDYSKVKYVGFRTRVEIVCPTHGSFLQSPRRHLKTTGCHKCQRNGHSRIAIRWIESEAKSRRMKNVQHAGNFGEFCIPGTRYKADGYHKSTNTIFEFHGDIFHGNPKTCKPNSKPNPFSNKTARQLLKETLEKERVLRSLGYRLITIWESEFRERELASMGQ